MLAKCQYLNECTPERGVILATGTPVSNSICEMYVMQRYLQSDKLSRMGLQQFDAWAATYGETTTALELAVEGNGYRFKTRFNRFRNLPELLTMFREIADVQTRDQLDLDVPEAEYRVQVAKLDTYGRKIMDSFVTRAEQIHNGGVDASVDNFLKLTTDARLLGTDARLLDPEAPKIRMESWSSASYVSNRSMMQLWQKERSGLSLSFRISEPRMMGAGSAFIPISKKD